VEEVKKKKILFIVNPVSGHGRSLKLEAVVEALIDKSIYEFEVVKTDHTGHAVELAKNAVERGFHIVAAVGGDGTVNEVGQSLVGTETAIAIIPSGSGNGLARDLKLPFNIVKSIQVINRGNLKKIDSATLNGRFFCNAAGIGYDAYVARKFAKAGTRGFKTYFRIVSGEYSMYRPRKYKINADGTEITRRALLITFANSSQFGNNTSIDPKAKLDDGLIDVCIVRRIPMLILPFYVPLLFTKNFHKSHYIEIIRAKSVLVTRKKGRAVHLDGDPHKMGKRIEMKINPLSLNVIVP
jgi:diacylglycerol kinase (ATP)